MSLDRAVNIASDFLAGVEGLSLTAYWDVNGYAIGFGNHYYQDGTAVRSGDRISEAGAYDLLGFYSDQFGRYVLSVITQPLNSNELAALISLAYNCGSLPASLRSVINAGVTPGLVAEAIRAACTGGNPDTIARRAKEAELYLRPDFGFWLAAAGVAAAIFFVPVLLKAPKTGP
jgi:lysozyme